MIKPTPAFQAPPEANPEWRVIPAAARCPSRFGFAACSQRPHHSATSLLGTHHWTVTPHHADVPPLGASRDQAHEVSLVGAHDKSAQQHVLQAPRTDGSKSLKQGFGERYNHGFSGQNEDNALRFRAAVLRWSH